MKPELCECRECGEVKVTPDTRGKWLCPNCKRPVMGLPNLSAELIGEEFMGVISRES